MSFPAYPSYRALSLKWVSRLPAHWTCKPLRYLVECRDGQRIPLNSEERAERAGDVPYWGANAIVAYVDEALFDEELVLLGEDGAPFFDPTRPVAFRSEGPIWPNNHVHVLRPNEPGSASFIVHALNATDFAEYIEGSTRDKLTQGKMLGIPVPWPPEDERTVIVEFLDRETARIDALIEEQQRLIELLKEKRQAVISHAVTKGLDPTAPMKDSGVEWLGLIPVHWAIEALKHGYAVFGGATPRSDIPEFWDGDVPWVTPADLSRSLTLEIEHTARTISDAGLVSCAASLVPAGSVILSTRAPIGSLGIAKRPVSTNQGCKSFVARRNGNPKFLYFVLSASTAALNARGKGTTFLELSGDELASFRVPTPSPEEQGAIAAFLDRETARIDALIDETASAKVLLQERRSALISAAVTGKIDVRGVHKPKPEFESSSYADL